ncbi:MAG: hypothetical protein KTR32_36685 [Granulosicoccus sp.]|nr:hypothetical protein [Granulosicoccus sp.]
MSLFKLPKLMFLMGMCLLQFNAYGSSGGIFDKYTAVTADNCANCHSGGSYSYDSDLLFDSEVSGDNVLSPGGTYSFTYSLNRVSGATAGAAGFNLYVENGELSNAGAGASIQAGASDQIAHDSRNTSNPFQWTFDWTAPTATGVVDMQYCGLPVSNTGDFAAGDGAVDCGSISIEISESPTANNDTATVDENSNNNSINVLSNDDAGASGDTKRVVGLCATSTQDSLCNSSSYTGASGSVTLSGTGVNNTVQFDPDADQTSTFSFKYKMENGAGQTDTATVSVSIDPEPSAGQAVNDSIRVDENSGTTQIRVLQNDLPSGENKVVAAICATTVTLPALCGQSSIATTLGRASVSSLGRISTIAFRPGLNQTGTFQVKYRMTYNGDNFLATLTIRVEDSDDAPPSFTSSPTRNATEGVVYRYDADATDPEGETLAYTLVRYPLGARINAKSGEISWLPGDNASATANFTVRATELGDSGQSAQQSFSVSVRLINDQPVITSTAPSEGRVNSLYEYQLEVTDPDDTPSELVYGLSNEPVGMTISNTGLVQWLPGEDSAGEYTFKVTAQDGLEDRTEQAVEIVTLTIVDEHTEIPEESTCFPVKTTANKIAIICF